MMFTQIYYVLDKRQFLNMHCQSVYVWLLSQQIKRELLAVPYAGSQIYNYKVLIYYHQI